MKPKKRQKLCCNCDGEIDLDVIVCPYCAADLREVKPEERLAASTVRPLIGDQQMSQSLYPPPYSSPETPPEQPPIVAEASTEVTPQLEKTSSPVGPTLLISLGVQLFLLGTLLMLFSDHGSVVLKWDARLWFLYLFASIPFLVFGYRKL